MIGRSANLDGNSVQSLYDSPNVTENLWEVLAPHVCTCHFNVEDEVDVYPYQ